MDQKTNNKNQMFVAVLTVLLKNKVSLETIPVLLVMLQEFQDKLIDIEDTARRAGVTLTGVTDDKNVKLTILRNIMFPIMTTMSTFAIRTKKYDLLAEIKFTESQIEDLRQNEILRLAEKVINYLKANKEILVTYGITAEKTADLEKAIQQVSDALPAPKVSISERKAANERLHVIAAETEDFLQEQMDGMIVPFRNTLEAFHKAYFNAREIYEYGVRHEKKKEEKEEKSVTTDKDK